MTMRSISACIFAARSCGVVQAANNNALTAAMMSCRMIDSSEQIGRAWQGSSKIELRGHDSYDP
jgi:hypothetical protein